MDEKLKRKAKGILLLLAGASMLFLGSVGAFNLFEKKQPSGYLGDEVPREMIETAYRAIPLETGETGSLAEDDSPVIMPAEATPFQMLPTLAAANPTEVNVAGNPTPAEPPLTETIHDETTQSTDTVEAEEVIPRWIYIKAIGLDAPIIPATSTVVEEEEGGITYRLVQWEAPDEEAAGWHSDSAPLGEVGNTVLNGHHNVYGKVFGNLVYLQEGDFIQIYGSDDQWYTYVVANKMVLPEEGVSLQKRMENAAWILPSTDERLTLITCWPEQSNTHRLIIVARPVRW
ncbi:MAG: sortase [Chloroflexi bacterium]|nr:sortase [Chloroflexota bacterium]